MKKIYQLGLIALMGVYTLSCGDEFLDYEPVAAENSSSFYITMAQAEQAVTAAYAPFNSRTIWDRNVTLEFGEVQSDDAESGGEEEGEVPDGEELNYLQPSAVNPYIDETYGNLFRAIYFANVALEKIPNVLNTDPSADAAIIEQRLGEMKFIRALNYMYLTHIWGTVPLADHVLGPSEYNNDKATIGEIYDLIERDLLEAIPVLPEKRELSSSDKGRAHKGAAKALLARMYLFESSYAANYPGDARFGDMSVRWQDALDLCEEVIASGEFRLMGVGGETFNTYWGAETNGYRYNFTVEGENSEESIFAIQFINDGEGYTNSRAGSLVQWSAARYCDIDGAKSQSSYWGLGWPTQAHVDAYESGDVRIETNVARPGDTIQIGGGARWPINFTSSATGYYLRKYELPSEYFSDAGGHGWQKSPGNIQLIRYADVILMASEAAFMLDQNSDALDYLNEIRERARDCGDGSVPAELTGTVTLEQIQNERRIELAFEGKRFFDLVRWGLADDMLDGVATPGGFVRDYSSPRNDFCPLPQREILINPNLTQNADW